MAGPVGPASSLINVSSVKGYKGWRNFRVRRLGDVRRRTQPVEKVDVGPTGGPKEPRNKVKTLRIHRFQPSNQGLKLARRCYSTRWPIPRTRVNKCKRKG